MLAAINYEDIGVVDEFMCGTALAGAAPATGLWPAKFTPATMSVGELHDTATRERAQAIEFAHPTSTRPSCPLNTVVTTLKRRHHTKLLRAPSISPADRHPTVKGAQLSQLD